MQRVTDTKEISVFRTERFFLGDGMWYFVTREQIDFGPFNSRVDAEVACKRYLDTQKTMARIRERDPVLNPDNTFNETGIATIAKEIRTWDDSKVGQIRGDEQRLDAVPDSD